ncbi:hypothetical protein K7X08_003499 [Anisodus acutangulus]|uniref:Secreted protein n=1 Tax=Anisodus acutangulus TaxID=402998 RepID=A0A9Q1RJQ7_9SOLA|nr:hypothetical protein K7X08_003499 [Anisodus acutangulus]
MRLKKKSRFRPRVFFLFPLLLSLFPLATGDRPTPPLFSITGPPAATLHCQMKFRSWMYPFERTHFKNSLRSFVPLSQPARQ